MSIDYHPEGEMGMCPLAFFPYLDDKGQIRPSRVFVDEEIRMVKSLVGKLSEMKPGTMKGVDIGGKMYLVANLEGKIFAMDGLCSHQQGRLFEGRLMGNVVKCPKHGSEFDIRTAKNLKGPWIPFAKAYDLKSYKTMVEGDDVFIDL
jgi:nitrite reductase/ring-hydroxylating ferredoxin subunit